MEDARRRLGGCARGSRPPVRCVRSAGEEEDEDRG